MMGAATGLDVEQAIALDVSDPSGSPSETLLSIGAPRTSELQQHHESFRFKQPIDHLGDPN